MDLFESTSINSMKIANRFVRSGTYTGMATDDGFMTPKLSGLLSDIAEGGVGLIVTDYTPVLANGITAPGQLAIYDDSFISGLSSMVDVVHSAGSKIVLQIVHGGAHTRFALTGEIPMGPSAIPETTGKTAKYRGCREMTQSDIDEVVEGFRLAAIRGKKAGFDAIQIHCSHGYLFSQFLSPFYNRRNDVYGGNISNRIRIVVDTYEQVRKEVGEDYPILIKMNVTDFLDDGITTDEAYEAAVIFERIGIDALELSGGTAWGPLILGDYNRSPMRVIKEEAYYRDAAIRLKETIKIPLILTGGVRSYHTAEEIVKNKIADFIGLCRPLIREPGLINRWKSGDEQDSGCISDNGCLFAVMNGKDLHCVKLVGGE